MNIAIMTFGRFNPIHKGHIKMINEIVSLSKQYNADLYIFLSQKYDNKNNPLKYSEKIKYLKMSLPKISKNIVKNPKIKTFFDAIEYLLNYDKIYIVVGSDRENEIRKNAKKYYGEKVEIISGGFRDPESNDVTGISSSKMRKYILLNQKTLFFDNLPNNISYKYKEEIFNLIQNRLKYK